jgi:hypothetical protein
MSELRAMGVFRSAVPYASAKEAGAHALKILQQAAPPAPWFDEEYSEPKVSRVQSMKKTKNTKKFLPGGTADQPPLGKEMCTLPRLIVGRVHVKQKNIFHSVDFYLEMFPRCQCRTRGGGASSLIVNFLICFLWCCIAGCWS